MFFLSFILSTKATTKFRRRGGRHCRDEGAFTWIFEHNSKLAVQDQKLIGLEKRLEENRAQTGKLSDVLHQLDKTMGSLIVEIRNLREEKGRHDK